MGLQDGDVAMDQASQAGMQTPAAEQPMSQAAPSAPSTMQTQSPPSQQVQDILDLGKHGKFKFDDKEWTLDDLRKSIMLQQDYTKKTQSFAKQRDMSEHYRHDIKMLKRNPERIEEFKQHYSQEWVDKALEDLAEWNNVFDEEFNKLSSKTSSKEDVQAHNADPRLLSEFRQLKNELGSLKNESFEAKVKAHQAEIDSTLQEMSAKYPRANAKLILSQARDLRDDGDELTRETWEDLFKANHKETEDTWNNWMQEQFKKQQNTSAKAKDMAPGGGIAGQAPRKRTLDEAEQDAISHYRG